jgi:hypothetical protein
MRTDCCELCPAPPPGPQASGSHHPLTTWTDTLSSQFWSASSSTKELKVGKGEISFIPSSLGSRHSDIPARQEETISTLPFSHRAEWQELLSSWVTGLNQPVFGLCRVLHTSMENKTAPSHFCHLPRGTAIIQCLKESSSATVQEAA